MKNDVLNVRVQLLVERLKKENMDAVILLNNDSIRYYTNFRMNTTSISMLLISSDCEVTYFVSKLDFNRAIRDCWIKNIVSFPEDNSNYFQPLVSKLISNIYHLGIEYSSMTLAQWKLIKDTYRGNVYDVGRIISELRMIKTDKEIEIIKKAASIADIAMQKSLKLAYSDKKIKEKDISSYAKFIMEEEGAEGLSFEPFVMSGKDSALPRRFSTKKVVGEDELIVFDMGAKYEGYCSDITRTFSLNKLSSKQKDIFEIALQSQKIAMESIKPGIASSELDKIPRDFIKTKGYGKNFPHLTGHGIGISEHEMPIIDEGDDILLQPNMVITIEPGIYVEGIGAARIEDMVLITDNGYELLTHTQRELVY